MDILNSNNEYLLSFLGSIIIPKSKLICLYYERELIYFSPYHCGWDAVIVFNCEGCGFLALVLWTRKVISDMVLVIETGGLFLAMNWFLEESRVSSVIILIGGKWFNLVESGLDDWRRSAIVPAIVLMIEGQWFYIAWSW